MASATAANPMITAPFRGTVRLRAWSQIRFCQPAARIGGHIKDRRPYQRSAAVPETRGAAGYSGGVLNTEAWRWRIGV
jgi:hypothetical protein